MPMKNKSKEQNKNKVEEEDGAASDGYHYGNGTLL
jgi:hypothetical protein